MFELTCSGNRICINKKKAFNPPCKFLLFCYQFQIGFIDWQLISIQKSHVVIQSSFYCSPLKFSLSRNHLRLLLLCFNAPTWQLGEGACCCRCARTSKVTSVRDVVGVKRTRRSCRLCSACWGEIRVILLTGSLAPFSRVSAVQCHYTSL